MPLRCALLILWAARSSGARPADVQEPLRHWTSLTAPPWSYDPEVAARAMWWSMVASYDKYKLQKRKIGAAHLKDKVWLDPTNEVLVFRDGPTHTAYVVFRGTSTLTDVKRDLSFMTVGYRPEVESWGTSRLDAFRSMLFPWRPRMHRGFAKRIDKYFAPIIVRLSKQFEHDQGCERIIFAGHSLGGAAAQGTAFLLTGWLKTLHRKLEASMSGASQSLSVPQGAGMSSGLKFEMVDGHLTMNGRVLRGMPKKGVKIEVYSFSAPRLGNWQLKMDYERTVSSSFNHVWGTDLVPLVAPWEYEMGWQLRALPMTMKPLNLSSRLQLFRPKILVDTVTRLHLDVVEAFLDFFDEQRDQLVKEGWVWGASKMKSDIGWLDVTKGITGLEEDKDEDAEEDPAPKEPTKRDRRLALARSSPKRSTGPFKYGSEVKIKIKPPGFRIGHVMKRMFSFMTDVAGLIFVPVAGLFLWHALRGVMDSIGPFQVDYSRFTDFQVTRLFADVPRVIIGLTVPMLMIFCAEIWLSTR